MAIPWLPLIGLGLQLFGALKGGQAAGAAAAKASAADAQQARLMKEYLKDYRSMRPIRQYLGHELADRASEMPFYADTWGYYGKGDDNIRPFPQLDKILPMPKPDNREGPRRKEPMSLYDYRGQGGGGAVRRFS